MAKIRVYVLAKELGLSNKEVIAHLKDLGVEVKSHSSSIEEETASMLRDLLKKEKSQVTEEKEAVKEVKPEPEKKEVKKVVLKEEKTLKEKPEVEKVPPQKEVVKKVEPPKPAIIKIDSDDISTKELADKLFLKVGDVIKELMKKGILATINQRIDLEIAKEIALIFGKEIESSAAEEGAQKLGEVLEEDESLLKLRPPVVTIMGHVDHGKTKLLDAIRNTRVTEKEKGGITQHIGAYQIEIDGKKVTFLDTPGHEAFTALRARGAKVTDIAVLVVAADDGIKPQTIEAIHHAQAAGVPILVAINKIDREEANVERVKQQLMDHSLVPEEWGGETIVVPVSAKENKGIDDLLEMILLMAEVKELKANPEGAAVGVVIEAKLDRGRGAVATLLVRSGTLKIGDPFHIGHIHGKIRALFNEWGERLKSAGPATPVEVLGFSDVPHAGEVLRVSESDKLAKEEALKEDLKRADSKDVRGRVVSLEELSSKIKDGQEVKTLNIILKSDVHGSFEALKESLKKLENENVKVNFVHGSTGAVSESDIMLAKASGAIVIGFHVSFDGNAESLAQEEGIDVRFYDIIYQAIEDVKLAMEGMLDPEYEEVVLGHIEVREIFKSSKVGVIAGSFVTDGKVIRGKEVRILRDKDLIYEGKLDSLKRFKEDVREVNAGYECGVSLSSFDNFSKGDIIEVFEMQRKK